MIRWLLAAALVLGVIPASAQNGARQVPLGFCSMSSMSSATLITVSTCAIASALTGTAGAGAAANILTVTAVTGAVTVGSTLSGAGIPAGTTVVAQLTGPLGGAGTYLTSVPTTASAASLTAGGIPLGTSYAILCAYTQAVNYRDDGGAVTGTTSGQAIAAGQCISYNGTFSQLQFFQVTSGAILGVSFYR